MGEFQVRGWCPGALRPMRSGDGWVVRVRPRMGRLTIAQAQGLCRAAQSHGAGLIDLTNRANLQIRGVSDETLAPLQKALASHDLLDKDAEMEARRNILIAPDWVAGDESSWLWAELAARLAELPALPPKVGFAIDAGAAPILHDTPADFRIERGASGGLILRAEGRGHGMALTAGTEIDTLIRLAHWFVASDGAQAGRMARHRAKLPGWGKWDASSAPARAPLGPGHSRCGLILGAAFGEVTADDLAQALATTDAKALRITPWRALILEDVRQTPALPDTLIATQDHPALRIDACAGAPLCPQATVDTRALALRLAPHVTGSLHVSGCAKGCARARAADITLVGRNGAFDMVSSGRADDTPIQSGLSTARILTRFGAC